MGVAYFSAAGNQNRDSYESAFRPSGLFIDIGFGPEQAHDFDPGTGVDICQQITIPEGGTLVVSFQWDQPFFSASGPPGSASDMDIVLANAACRTVREFSADPNVGEDPVEVFGFTNPPGSGVTTFNLLILKFRGPKPKLMKTVSFESGSFDEFNTASGTSFGHNSAVGGLGVGAAFYQQTPAFGTTPPVIEAFSSAGGTPILFDIAGNRLSAPEIRAQPDITAPDGSDTTFFGSSDKEPNGFPNFSGTSAAAPHAAAVAALMKGLNAALTPDAIYGALKATAIDMDDPHTPGFDNGFDFGTGYGLIQADAALGAAAAPPPVCRDFLPTIVGTEGDDIITGTEGPDVIAGLGGNDEIVGLGGNDLICGGEGNDLIKGRGGHDTLDGGPGDDIVKGGRGRDTLDGGPDNNDILRGGLGRDTCVNGEDNRSCKTL